MANADRTSLALLLEDSDAEAMVKMRDGDTFFIAMTDAARACQAMEKGKDFSVQWRLLLEILEQWIESERPKIKSAYITVRDHDMLFLVMQKAQEFDPDLAKSLTGLDLTVANSEDLDLIDMEVMAIPAVSEDTAKAFLSSGRILTYAHESSPRSRGKEKPAHG